MGKLFATVKTADHARLYETHQKPLTSGFFYWYFMDIQKARKAYLAQKHGAARRCIEWELTFREWCDFWGEDINRRGSRHDQLCMQRFHDKGPYKLGNIKKGYPRENAKTAGNVRRSMFSNKCKAAYNASLDAADAISKDYEEEDMSISEFYSRGGNGKIDGEYISIYKGR